MSSGDELVAVDPRFAPEHAAYYFAGLQERFSVRDLPWSRQGFPDRYTDHQPLSFVVRRGHVSRKIYIAAGDKAELDRSALAWADVYGKVNLDPGVVPAEHRHKLVAIGPSHAVRLWTSAESARLAVRTLANGGRIAPSVRDHLRRHWINDRRRVGADHYEPGPSEARYVYYNSWLWAKHDDANPPRAEFVRACQELAAADVLTFEGGFIPRRRADLPGYEDVTADRKYSLPEYLERIKRSTVVFNNPTVHRCHGWKLGEFLRLGKAIVSTPLSREMPAPLEHGVHVHYVDGSRASIKDAVSELVEQPDYRARLEQAARRYWVDHLAPARVVERLVDEAFTEHDERRVPGAAASG